MDDKRTEACGRCSMTSVVSMTDEGDRAERNPFDGERIEVPESEMQSVNRHQVLLGRVKRRLDEVATRLTYSR